MFIYEQSSGRLLRESGGSLRPIALGYAGAPGFVNDPEASHLVGTGPLPVGRYTIRQIEHPRYASPCFRLIPDPGNRMFGRSGFLIHGDNALLNRSASHGCIVLDKRARLRVGDLVASGDNVLEVVS